MEKNGVMPDEFGDMILCKVFMRKISNPFREILQDDVLDAQVEELVLAPGDSA